MSPPTKILVGIRPRHPRRGWRLCFSQSHTYDKQIRYSVRLVDVIIRVYLVDDRSWWVCSKCSLSLRGRMLDWINEEAENIDDPEANHPSNTLQHTPGRLYRLSGSGRELMHRCDWSIYTEGLRLRVSSIQSTLKSYVHATQLVYAKDNAMSHTILRQC